MKQALLPTAFFINEFIYEKEERVDYSPLG